MSTHINKKTYSNCKIYSPDMKLMCVNSAKKGLWYVEKTGAKILSYKDDGSLNEIQLTFKPKGTGYKTGEVFGVTVQETRCVVSGETDISKLTKHHIVPISYRRHLPIEYKSRNHHDVVYITKDLHEKYESIGNLFRDELARKYGAMTYKEVSDYFSAGICSPEAKLLKKIKSYLDAIALSKKKIPAAKYKEMLKTVSSFAKEFHCLETDGKSSDINKAILKSTINKIDEIKTKYKLDPHKQLVDKITDYDEFIKTWRQHFIDTCSPKFLPIGWDINYHCKVDL